MTQEEKELLLKDLCARLPYHPNCYCKWLEKAPNGTNGCVQELSTFVIDEIEIMDDPQFKCQICDVKPYLRPMSSMTEEEYETFPIPYSFDSFSTWNNTILSEVIEGTQILIGIDEITEIIDWLNRHHFDYRGLIKKGLALEAPKGMYEIVPSSI